jgi:hypothetical protein
MGIYLPVGGLSGKQKPATKILNVPISGRSHFRTFPFQNVFHFRTKKKRNGWPSGNFAAHPESNNQGGLYQNAKHH